jgi:hypothetical protein
MTLRDSARSTCSPESEASLSPLGLPDCPMTMPCSPEARPVSLLPLPEPCAANRMTVISGRKWLGLLPKSERAASFTRTLLEHPGFQSTECVLTWKAKGTKYARRLYFQLVPSMRRTGGIGSGLWPTVSVRGLHNRKGASKTSGDGLSTAVKAALWSTPQARDGTPRGAQAKRYLDPNWSNDLPDEVALWTTPCADDTGHRKNLYAQGGTALSTQTGGALNPEFVCWLMGYPSEWLNCTPSGMPLSRKSQRKS